MLVENRLEFDYSFPIGTGNSVTAYLHRSSDNVQLDAEPITGDVVGWATYPWKWSGNYIGTTVYVRFVAGANPWWIDNVGGNVVDALSRQNHKSVDAGDPFDTSTAQSTHSHTDIVIPGRGIPLEFSRSYNSLSATVGDLGYGWRHNYSSSLRVDGDQSVTVTYGSGGGAYFTYNGGTYTPPAGVHDTLVKNGDNTYTLTTKAQIRYNFDTGGKLATIKDRNDNTTTLTYTGGLLTSVTDASFLRSLTFTYDGSNRIFRVTDPLPSPGTRAVEFQYDGNGDLWKVKDVKADPTNGPFTVYAYSNHRMDSLTDSNGHLQSTNIYDGANRVVEQTDASGGKTCSYYGTPPAYTNPPVCPGVTPPPAAGQTVVVNPRGFKTTYDFDTKFRTTGITDHDGGVTTYTYDSSDNVTCVTDPRGKKTAYRFYDAKGNVGEIIDALNTEANCALKVGGVKWTYTYTANNDVDLETDPLARQTDYIYDTPGNLTRIERRDAGGSVKALTCLERDSFGQVTATVQSTNLTRPPGATDPCTGNKTILGYDTYGNLTCTVNARFTGTTTCASDPGKKASFIYDLGGRLLYSTNEITNNSKPVRGSMPEIGSQCGADGNGNDVDDDDNAADDAVIDDGCPSTKHIYDAQNNVLTVTDGLGNVTTSIYDAKGNLTSVKDANRKTAGANPESGTAQCGTEGTGDGENDDTADDTVIDDGCLSIVYKYDNGDRLEEVIQAAVSTTSVPSTTYGYDGNGNRTSVTNPNRQSAGASPESGTAQCGAAGTGNGVNDEPLDDSLVDDGCPSMKHAYDSLDRLQSTTGAIDYLGRVAVTSYQYDAASNLTQRTDAQGLITKYIPDDLSRVDQIEHRNAVNTLVDSVDFTYDEVNNRHTMLEQTYDSQGGVVSSSQTDYIPDLLGRPISVTTNAGTPSPKTVLYAYDDPDGVGAEYPGQRTQITYPDGKIVSYTYENDGRMKRVTDWLSKQTVYNYDDTGRLIETQLPNGVYTHHKYDAADRLTCVVNDGTAAPPPTCTSATMISKFEYPLIDAVGNRMQMVDGAGTHIYQNDALHRLREVAYPSPPQTDTYTYDANGNRLTKNATTYSYDAADQMTATGGITYSYDQNGNQTGRASDAFFYDHENRLTKINIGGQERDPCYDFNGDGAVTGADLNAVASKIGTDSSSPNWDPFYDIAPAPNGDGQITGGDLNLVAGQSGADCSTSRFTYNGDGLRATRRSSRSLDMRYVWDVASGLPVVLKEEDLHNALLDGQGADNTYVYGLDLISVTDRTGAQSYFLYDGLGSTSNISDTTGNVTATYSYDVFGAIRSESGAGAAGNEWRFTGEERDPQGNRQLYYLRARYYDPANGRFLSHDPLPTGNLYAYVDNNPINLVDPSGLCPNSCEGGFASPCRIPLNCSSINYDKILEKLPEYLACVSFGIALLAWFYENPWLVAAAIGIDIAAEIIEPGSGGGEAAVVGGTVAGGAAAYQQAAKFYKPKGTRWDQPGVKGFAKVINAIAVAYGAVGCAKKVGIFVAEEV